MTWLRGLCEATLLLAALTLAAPTAAAAANATTPWATATTPHFAFHSDFATNLNDALIAAGIARNFERDELFHSGAEAACFDELPPSMRSGWNLAVDYYAQVISPADWDDRQQYLLRAYLADLPKAPDDERARQFVDIARGLWAAAGPAYESCEWTAQDAKNRRWIGALIPRLERHGTAIGARLEQLYQRPWQGLPIRVDVVSTAPRVGANSLADPPHILISTLVDEREALETVFHEASHTLTAPWRPDPVPQALEEAAQELGMPSPGDLWHVVLFYTTGEVVRQALKSAGEPGYTPYIIAHDLWRGRWGRYRDGIEAVWPAYVAGERSLDEAARDLLRTLGADDEASP